MGREGPRARRQSADAPPAGRSERVEPGGDPQVGPPAPNDPIDIHTVTFGPEAVRSQIEQTFNAPQGQPAHLILILNPLAGDPSEPPGSPSPLPDTGAIECVVHPHMDGVIAVK